MKELAISGYPQGQTPSRRKITDLLYKSRLAVLKSKSSSDNGLLDNFDRISDFPGRDVFHPHDFATDDLISKSEAEAYEVSSTWHESIRSLIGEQALSAKNVDLALLGVAIEAELFRLFKEFIVAVAVAEKAIEKLDPVSVRFFNEDTGSVASLPDGLQVSGTHFDFMAGGIEKAVDIARMLREFRGWKLEPKEKEATVGKEYLFFSDMESQARALAPVILSLGLDNSAVIDPSPGGRRAYSESQIPVLVPKRKKIPLIKLKNDPALKAMENGLLSLAGDEKYRIFRSAWARRQVLLLLSQAAAWDEFWRDILASCENRVSIVSVAIWPAFRTFLSRSRSVGRKTAILMHGNIPAYRYYYSKPQPDIYCVYGEVYRGNLVRCGMKPDTVEVTGSTSLSGVRDAASVIESGEKAYTEKRPRVVFLQSPPGSEMSWLEYQKAVHLFMEAVSARPEWDFMVKLHPHPSNTGDEFREMIGRYGVNNLDIVKELNVRECLAGAGASVAIYSTTILDSLDMGIPVVVINPRRGAPLMPFGEMGLAGEARDIAELLGNLDEAISGGASADFDDAAKTAFVRRTGSEAVKAVTRLL